MPSNSSSNVVSFTAEKMLYESVRRFSVINLSDLIRVLMENIDDSLFELSDKAKSDRDRNMYFEAMREIRLKREEIQTLFNEELQQRFNDLISLQTSKKTSDDSNELSLLDQDELEDSLAIDNMISKARPHFEDDLFAISERLKAILNRKEINDNQNPLDPKSICDSFHNASEILEVEIQVKLIFYKLFDKYVMANLGHFYSELNEYFIKKGVLTNFKASEERANQTTQFMANRIRSNPNSQKEQEEMSAALTQQSVQTELQNMPAAEGSLLSLLQQMISPVGHAQATGGTAPSAAIPMVDMNLSSEAPNDNNAAPSNLTGLAPAAQNTAYISALTHLQNSHAGFNSAGINADPEAIKAQLQQQIVTFKEENSQQSNAIDNQVIDIVSMIFDFFFEDDALPNPIKVLIGRLQIPVLKVAIIDNSFFNSKKHPARQLLDSISKASLGWSDKTESEDVLISKIESIIETLLLDFDQDIVVFENALNQLKEFIHSEKTESNEQLESVIAIEQDGDDKISKAQELSHFFINKLIDKHDLNFEIIDFIDGIWKSVLYHTLLTKGEESSHWKSIKRTSTTLVWTLIVKQTEEDKRKLFKTLPALLRALSKGMELIKLGEDDKNAVFQMLVKEHAKIVRLSNKNMVTRVNDTTVWPRENMEAAFANARKLDNLEQKVDINLSELDEYIENNEEDSVGEINSFETEVVISSLDEFTASIANGDIQIDDEIIMDSSPHLQISVEANSAQDDFLEIAQNLEIGTWVEFNDNDSEILQGKLSWKSNVTGKFVFVNRHGVKIKNMTSFGLSVEFRSGNAKLMQSSSIFDRALNSLMTSIGR